MPKAIEITSFKQKNLLFVSPLKDSGFKSFKTAIKLQQMYTQTERNSLIAKALSINYQRDGQWFSPLH